MIFMQMCDMGLVPITLATQAGQEGLGWERGLSGWGGWARICFLRIRPRPESGFGALRAKRRMCLAPRISPQVGWRGGIETRI
jgi:hypothetical protein